MTENSNANSHQTPDESQQEPQIAWSEWNRESKYNYSRIATLPDGRIRIEYRAPRTYSGSVVDSYDKLNQRYSFYPIWTISNLDDPATPEIYMIRLGGTDRSWGKTFHIDKKLDVNICDNREKQFAKDEEVPLIALHYTHDYQLESVMVTTDRIGSAPLEERFKDLIAKPYSETFPIFYAYMRELSETYLTNNLDAFYDYNEELLSDFEASVPEAESLAFKIETDLINTLSLRDQAESGDIVKKYRLRDRIVRELLANKKQFLSHGLDLTVDQARKAYSGKAGDQFKESDDRLINSFVGSELHSLMFDAISSYHETSVDISNIHDDDAEVAVQNITIDENFITDTQEVWRKRIGFGDKIRVGRTILSLDKNKNKDRLMIKSENRNNNWTSSIPLDLSVQIDDIDEIFFDPETDFRKLNELIPVTFEFILQN